MPERLSLYDYSDRELLHLIEEVKLDSGWSRTEDVAKAVGLTSDKPNRPAGIRLAWMRRYGALEKHETQPWWRLTPIGRSLMDGELTADERETIDEWSSAQLLMVTRRLTGRWRRAGTTASTLIRREWQRGTHR